MSDRLKGIEVFVQAVEAGGFARAAERLHLSRSAVGKTIARLEQRLGVRLFHRTTRRQSVTEEGQAFYERCLRALAELEAAEAALDGGRGAPSGRLRVSASTLFGRHCVAPVLLALQERHPTLELELSLGDRIVDLVEEGFDLAVRLGALPDSASLTTRRLGRYQMAIWAAPAYLAAHGRPAGPEDLAGHRGIVYARPGYDLPWQVGDAGGGVRELRIASRLRLDDVQAIADAAAAGAGLAWLPCWLAVPLMQAGKLEPVLDLRQAVGSDIHLVWPQNRYLPAKTRAAIDALAAEIPRLIAQPAKGEGRSPFGRSPDGPFAGAAAGSA